MTSAQNFLYNQPPATVASSKEESSCSQTQTKYKNLSTILGTARATGIANLLNTAANIITQYGHTKGGTLDPTTKQISARGAILIAAGAKPANILGFDTTPEEAKVPNYTIPKAYEAIEIVAYNHDDIDIWNDLPDTTAHTIATEFRRLANLIEISII